MRNGRQVFALLLAALCLSTNAGAEGSVELAWQQCREEAGALLDQSPICDAALLPMKLVITFRPGEAIPDFKGIIVAVTIGPSVTDLWGFNPGGCRSGALALGDPGSVECSNPYEGTTTTESVSYITGSKYPGYVEFRVHVTRAAPRELLASETYVAAVLEIQGADVVTQANCTGCEQPMCIGVAAGWVTGESGAVYTLHAGEPESVVTWQGGYTTCYGVTPTRRTTWGELKVLYR